MNPNIKQICKKNFQRTKLPPLEIELILAHVLKKSREYVLAHMEYALTPKQISNFKFQISKRIKGMPLAYIIGHKEFYGLDFMVNKNILIPRPETELMVEEALKLITCLRLPAQAGRQAHNAKSPIDKGGLGDFLNSKEKITLIDIGTGSGCVIITLAKFLRDLEKSDFLFLANDISRPALSVARKNAKFHHVNKIIKFYRGNLLEPIEKIKSTFACPAPAWDIPARLASQREAGRRHSTIFITANLPYLTPTQIKNSPTIKYEPKNALNGGLDGLKYYRQLFKQIKKLSMSCISCYMLCEIDPRQTSAMKKLIKQELPKAYVQIKKDLCGHNRLVIINFSSPYYRVPL